MQELVRRLNAICEAQPFETTWYVKDLATGTEADRGGDRVVPSASTRKTSILVHALKRVQEGRLDLKEPCTIEARLQEGVASGTYQHMTPGCVIPLRDALVNMIITSDNVCTQMVLERLDTPSLNAWCREIGMVGTTHRAPIPPVGLAWDHPAEAVATTTARDQGLLLDLLLRAAQGDAAASARLGVDATRAGFALDVLSWQKLWQLIPSLLPYGTRVACKTGRGARGRMDAGIVWRGERPLFILTVYTDRVPETMPDGLPGFSAAFATAGKLARACWDALP